jgi:hypothetical protein
MIHHGTGPAAAMKLGGRVVFIESTQIGPNGAKWGQMGPNGVSVIFQNINNSVGSGKVTLIPFSR